MSAASPNRLRFLSRWSRNSRQVTASVAATIATASQMHGPVGPREYRKPRHEQPGRQRRMFVAEAQNVAPTAPPRMRRRADRPAPATRFEKPSTARRRRQASSRRRHPRCGRRSIAAQAVPGASRRPRATDADGRRARDEQQSLQMDATQIPAPQARHNAAIGGALHLLRAPRYLRRPWTALHP